MWVMCYTFIRYLGTTPFNSCCVRLKRTEMDVIMLHCFCSASLELFSVNCTGFYKWTKGPLWWKNKEEIHLSGSDLER